MECVACGIRQSSEKSNQQSKTTTQNMGLDKHFLSYKDDRTGWNVRKSVESEDGGCGHHDEIVVEVRHVAKRAKSYVKGFKNRRGGN